MLDESYLVSVKGAPGHTSHDGFILYLWLGRFAFNY